MNLILGLEPFWATRELFGSLVSVVMPKLLLQALQTTARRSQSLVHLLAHSLMFQSCSKVWDNENGKSIFTLPHGHIVRSVALSAMSQNKLITGTQDKRLRLYDLNAVIGPSNPEHPNGVAIGPDSANQIGSTSSEGSQAQYVELGQGIHQGSIKSIVYDPHSDFNFATACDDRTIRWWDLRDYKCTAEFKVAGSIGSCELNIIDGLHNNTPGGGPRGVLSAAAGDTVYFFDGLKPGMLIKQIKLPHDVPTVSLNYEKNQFITGSNRDPWVHVYDFHMDPMEPEVEVLKGHHGTVWTTQFSPDGKVFATGGDDAMVKIWKYCDEPYGLWGGSIEQTTNGA